MSSPATTIGSRQFISAVKRASASIVALDVTSPPDTKVLGQHAPDEIADIEARQVRQFDRRAVYPISPCPVQSPLTRGCGRTQASGASASRSPDVDIHRSPSRTKWSALRSANPAPAQASTATVTAPGVDLDQVEALFLVAQSGRGRCPRLDYQRRPRSRHQLMGVVGRGAMVVAGEQQVDAGLGDRVERQLLPSDRLAKRRPVADRKGEQRMVGDQDPRRIRAGSGRSSGG